MQLLFKTQLLQEELNILLPAQEGSHSRILQLHGRQHLSPENEIERKLRPQLLKDN